MSTHPPVLTQQTHYQRQASVTVINGLPEEYTWAASAVYPPKVPAVHVDLGEPLSGQERHLGCGYMMARPAKGLFLDSLPWLSLAGVLHHQPNVHLSQSQSG